MTYNVFSGTLNPTQSIVIYCGSMQQIELAIHPLLSAHKYSISYYITYHRVHFNSHFAGPTISFPPLVPRKPIDIV